MKQRITNLILILILLIGLSLLLYPTISNWWNSMHQSRAIASYSEAVSQVDPAIFKDARSAAQSYNEVTSG